MTQESRKPKKVLYVLLGLSLALTAVAIAPTASAWCTPPRYVGGVAEVNVADCAHDCYVEVHAERVDTPCVN
ncbi:MAG TPA: hypothetical protein VHH36_09250 [Candidatus Thermoplasmatota archaeon]|nr:hypothetical protein [Candidatus Thermoplasmatota archaeon]